MAATPAAPTVSAGLSSREAADRLKQFGPNEPAPKNAADQFSSCSSFF